MRVIIVTLLAGLFFAINLQAKPLTADEKLSDFYQLVSTMESGYGPKEYKKTLGIQISSLKANYEDKIRNSKTNGEFYYLIVQFIAEFQDSHFGASLPTDHKSVLPFTTELVDGKVLIDNIDTKMLPKFDFERGDEIVSFDGKPINEVLDDLKKYSSAGYDLTRTRSAARMVTSRAGSRVPVPTGEVSLEIRRGTSEIIENVKMEWVTTGTPLDESKDFKVEEPEKLITDYPFYFDSFSSRDMWDDTFSNLERSYQCSGSTRIAIPEGATVLIDSPFVAYYHKTEKGNVGYLRIPHYMPRNQSTGEFEFELRHNQYEWALSELEKNTVGLIIDQDHNCGGSVTYLENLVGLFMDKEVDPMQFELLASKENFLSYKGYLEKSNPHTKEFHTVKNVFALITDYWKKGNFLTSKTSIAGNKAIDPKGVYSKPILMLIDEVSGSGGDAFPSLMQGYGRAKLFGTRTMGAGGHVVSMPALNYSQISYRMTKSLFYRPDGVPVENNGANPDVSYKITRDDFVYKYKNYQKAYLKELLKMIP